MSDPHIELEFNPRKAVKHFEQYATIASDLSRLTRSHRPGRLDVRYGPGKRATLDVFPAAQANAPIHVFLHGGYWRGRDKSDYSYVADALVPLGITTVVMNYDLCPDVELPEIVHQVGAGLAWIHANAAVLGGAADSITVSGHSAGAHLIAAALAGDTRLAAMPRAAILISGIYDLTPVLSISVNQEIRLRPEQVRPMSPVHHPLPSSVPLKVVVGGAETKGFIDQSQTLAAVCRTQGVSAEYVELAGHDHYTIMRLLETPDGALARMIDTIAWHGSAKPTDRP